MSEELFDAMQKLRMYYDLTSLNSQMASTIDSVSDNDKRYKQFSILFTDKSDPKTNTEIINTLLHDQQGSTVEQPTFTVFSSEKNSSGTSSLFGSVIAGTALEDAHTSSNKDTHTPSVNTLFVQVGSIDNVPISLPITKDTDFFETFMNYIPTIERSKCVPYVSADFFTANNMQTKPALTLFLGSKDNKFDKTFDILTNASPDEANLIAQGSRENGMEMFSMPQSIISNNTELADIFRPLLTFSKASISIRSLKAGVLSFPTANLELVLHDRSRIGDLSFLLDPGKYSGTKILLETGWSHSSGNSTVYGQFINHLRNKTLYSINHSDFKFQNDGSVNISLSLSLAKTGNLQNEPAFKSGQIGSTINELHKTITQSVNKLGTAINKLNGYISKSDNKLLPNIITESKDEMQVYEINQEALTRLLESYNDITTTIETSNKRSHDAAQKELDGAKANIKAALAELLLNDEKNTFGKITSFNDKINNLLSTFCEELRMIKVDPFIAAEDSASNSEVRDFISFGTLLTNIISKPLLSGTKTGADNIQIISYNFNNYAAGMRGKNLAEFKINIDEIEKKLKNVLSKNYTITVASFINIVKALMLNKRDEQYKINTNKESGSISKLQEDLDNKASLISSLKTAISKHEGDPPSNLPANLKAAEREYNEINKDIEKRQTENIGKLTKDMGIANIRMPTLKITIDSLKTKSGETISRLHIFDANSQPYESQIAAANMASSISIPSESSSQAKQHTSSAAFFEALHKKGLIVKKTKEVENEDGTKINASYYKLNARSNILKDMIKNSMPHVNFANSGTAINSASFSTISDKNMKTFHMLERQKDEDGKVPGVLGNAKPQLSAEIVMPVEVSMEIFGFPLIDYAQQFFIDFETNSDIDNIYYVTAIKHSFSPGSFKTSLSLKPSGTGLPKSFVNIINDAISVANDADDI